MPNKIKKKNDSPKYQKNLKYFWRYGKRRSKLTNNIDLLKNKSADHE